MIYEPINVSGIGAAIIVPLQKTFRVVVYSYLLVASGGVVADFEDTDGNILSGPYSIGIAGGNAAAHNEKGHFRTAVGKGLSIGLDANVQVGGHIVYDLVYEG